jgi:hypothetical protein
MPRLSLAALSAVFALLGSATGPALADEASFAITIKDHRFEPHTLQVPAGKRIVLLIHNADPTPEEFESYELNREKIVPGGSDLKIYIGPLNAGIYPFFGDFNQATAQGKIIAS